ncbi:hypothetical protein CBP16_19015 [Fischerella thermalis WC217]|nr:hypothetical protein CBP16_19015 [Fischerella thermalis WC217]
MGKTYVHPTFPPPHHPITPFHCEELGLSLSRQEDVGVELEEVLVDGVYLIRGITGVEEFEYCLRRRD